MNRTMSPGERATGSSEPAGAATAGDERNTVDRNRTASRTSTPRNPATQGDRGHGVSTDRSGARGTSGQAPGANTSAREPSTPRPQLRADEQTYQLEGSGIESHVGKQVQVTGVIVSEGAAPVTGTKETAPAPNGNQTPNGKTPMVGTNMRTDLAVARLRVQSITDAGGGCQR